MSINIKNKEAERLLAEIKQKTGKGTSQIVLDLLRAERARIDADKQKSVAEALAWTRHWQADIAARTPPDAPSVDEILQWDENGLPR